MRLPDEARGGHLPTAHAVEVGEPDGIPVFWVHGRLIGDLDGASFEPIAAGVGLRIICAALPGTRE